MKQDLYNHDIEGLTSDEWIRLQREARAREEEAIARSIDEAEAIASLDDYPKYCDRCGEKLAEDKIVWLELDQDTGLYTDRDLPEGHTSQGGFSFGRSCAKTVLANGGKNDRIKKQKGSIR